MYADPQTLTINTVATPFIRVGSDTPGKKGVFTSADGAYTLQVAQNSTNSRFRREVRLTWKKIAPDPISAENKEVSASFIIAFDEPRAGFSDTELGYLDAALRTWFAASGHNTSLLVGEL